MLTKPLIDMRRRGLLAVRAETAPTDAELAAAFETFKTTFGATLTGIETALDKHALLLAAMQLNGSGPAGILAADPAYSGLFTGFVRKGANEHNLQAANAEGSRAAIQASMSVGSNSDGGYLAPVEWDRKIGQAQRAVSPIRRIANVVTTNVGAYSTLWNTAAWGSGWVGETATRPGTSSATLAPVLFTEGEIYANIAVTQRLLDDSEIPLDQWVSDQIATEFSRQEGIAFVSGDGVNKPMGFLQYLVGSAGATSHPGGVLSVTNSGNAALITADQLVQIKYDLAAPYRQNATWLMNSQTAAAVAKLKDGSGNFLWRESFLASQPSTLLGSPVEIDENMPNVAANAYAIAFGDFKAGYVINDRLGVRILRDPYTNKPFVMLYATKRVGAGVSDPNAIRLMKISA